MWRAFYLVFSLSSSQWVYLVDRTFSNYKQIQPPANKRCTRGKRTQHEYHRGDQWGGLEWQIVVKGKRRSGGNQAGYSASNVGNAGGRRGGVERTRDGQKADKTRSGRGKTEGGADKEQSGQDWGGKRTDGQDKELTREGADKGRGGSEEQAHGARCEERVRGTDVWANAWAGTKNGQATFTLNGR